MNSTKSSPIPKKIQFNQDNLGKSPQIDTPISIDETQRDLNSKQDSGITINKGDDNIDDGTIKYENNIADSSSQFFSDFAKSSYPDSRTNMNNIQRDMTGLSKLSSELLNSDIMIDCINNILQTEKYNDSLYINFLKTNNIDAYKSEHFEYISEKVSKFLSLGPEDYATCLQKLPHNSGIKKIVCNGKIITLSIYYIGQVFEFFGNAIDTTSIKPNTKEYQNFKRLYDIFLNNTNSIVKKSIEISKYFEQKYCDNQLSTNTLIADMFYKKLLTSGKANVEYKLFDNVNIKIGFLDELRKSFFGQAMILICLFLILWKIIGLFNK